MARKRQPTKLLKRWFAVQEALGWDAVQMGAVIGVTKGAWNSWKRGHYHPGQKTEATLKSLIDQYEDRATAPAHKTPPPKLPVKKERSPRCYNVEMSVPMLQRILKSITFSNDDEPSGIVKLHIEQRKVIGAEYVVQIVE